MAYIIIDKERPNVVYKICAESDFNNHAHYYNEQRYAKVSISEQDYLDYKNAVKDTQTVSLNLVTFENVGPFVFNTKDEMQEKVDNYIKHLNNFITGNPNSGYIERATNTKNFLTQLDLNTLTFPLNHNLLTYLASAYPNFVLLLELP